MNRILFLIDNFGSGGAQRQMTTIAVLLKQKGYNVSFLTYSLGDFFKEKIEEQNIPIYKISTTNNLNRILKIRHYIRKGNFDAVISFMDTPNFLNCCAAIGQHKWKVITSERSCNESIFYNRKSKIFNWFQRYSDAIVCNSERAKQMWIKHYPKYEKKLRVIYNTVQLPKINTRYIPMKDNKIHIVVGASYQALKNPIGVIKALSLLNDEEKNIIQIDWYGRINTDLKNKSLIYNEAISLIKDLDLSNCIKLHDESNNIQELMNQADFVGLFSLYEGLPNVICEAMTIGKAIIITPVSDYNRFVNDENGIVCKSASPDDIAIALQSIISKTSISELINMGMCSKRKSNLYNKNVIISEWLSILEKR